MGEYRHTSRQEFLFLMKKFSLTWLEVQEFNKSYRIHRWNAVGRGHKFEFTLAEWTEEWVTSGHWKNRGFKAAQYCMARLNDLRIITNRENRGEQVVLGIKGIKNPRHRDNPASKEIRLRLSNEMSGNRNPMSRRSLAARRERKCQEFYSQFEPLD